MASQRFYEYEFNNQKTHEVNPKQFGVYFILR